MNDLAWFKSSYSGGDGGNCLEVAFDWRKSSYSGASGGECVEVASDWRKSSHSDSSGGNCLEVSISPGSSVHVRDSKDPDGPALRFDPAEWAAFVGLARGNPFTA